METKDGPCEWGGEAIVFCKDLGAVIRAARESGSRSPRIFTSHGDRAVYLDLHSGNSEPTPAPRADFCPFCGGCLR